LGRSLKTLNQKIIVIGIIITFLFVTIGYLYLQSVDHSLRTSLETSLKNNLQLTADTLIIPSLIDFNWPQTDFSDQPYFVPFDKKNNIQIDGALIDWSSLKTSLAYPISNTESTFKLTHDGEYLFFMINIIDEQLELEKGAEGIFGDRVIIDLDQYPDLLTFGINSNGTIKAYATHPETFVPALRPISSPYLDGYSIETEEGYLLELKIPFDWIGNYIEIKIGNISPSSLSLSFDTTSLMPIILQSQFLDDKLKNISPLNKLYITNDKGWILYESDNEKLISLTNTNINFDASFLFTLYRKLIKRNLESIDALKERDLFTVANPIIRSSLDGVPGSVWFLDESGYDNILITSVPIKIDNNVVGMILMKDSATTITSLIGRLLSVFIVQMTFFAAMIWLLLLLFSKSLVSRITRLANATENAISSEGNLTILLPENRSKDEVGNLSRSFSSLLDRLNDQRDYLITLKGKLAHELRTPLAIITTSIKNIRLNQDPQKILEDDKYLGRIENATHRLEMMISSMSETNQIEDAIRTTKKEAFNFIIFFDEYIEAIKMTTSKIIKVNTIYLTNYESMIKGDKDLIAQGLDKIFQNALDFTDDNTVKVTIDIQAKQTTMEIYNQGPPLRAKNNINWFSPLQSRRTIDEEKNHMGFGLYLARLIIHFHSGEITISNKNKGVCVNITLPHQKVKR
jgi:two-component system sensor histidine kinase ChvG